MSVIRKLIPDSVVTYLYFMTYFNVPISSIVSGMRQRVIPALHAACIDSVFIACDKVAVSLFVTLA